ncbi:preprotein translocase subunit SecY [Deltaproteobacteria bacterium Smac51]|nr:preprotein translocase subunit SecY [Deltaproteobacteria bacterium Smac51]
MALGGLENIGRAPELRKRIFFVLIMLAVYRVGVHIPTPGVNGAALAELFQGFQGTLLGLFDMFSGRALSQFSVFALGIMPYISASIIVELLTVVWPHFTRLKKEGGRDGRRKLTQYARYGTVLLSLFQGYLIAVGLEQTQVGSGSVVIEPGVQFRLMTMITLTAGTAFIMWLGEQITERGIGNGISLIIFAGIVEGLPSATISTIKQVSDGEMSPFTAIIMLAGMLLIIGAVVFCERAQRRITVQHAQRMVGRRLMKGGSTHLPLKLNPAGVIPPIFASSLIMFPATLATFIDHDYFKMAADYLRPGSWLYNLLYVALIVFFCYFYTGVTFNPTDVAENMKKQGGFIPGIRPGARTAEYIDKILTRLIMWGALYVSLICLLPTFVSQYFHAQFYFGGTALLIVVGVAIDTMGQIQSHLMNQHYESFMKSGGGASTAPGMATGRIRR